jgi:putative ABC transport system permease protein
MKFAVRQLVGSFRRRLPRYLPAVLAIAVAAAAVGALGSLSSDVGRKMTAEFRLRGANAVARGRAGEALDGRTVHALERSPAVVRALPVRLREAASGQRRLIAVGLDFERAAPFLAGWEVEGRLPEAPGEALAGARLFERIKPGPGLRLDEAATAPQSGREVELVLSAGERRRFHVVGLVSTGEGEDEELLVRRVELPAADLDSAEAVLLRLSGSGSQVAAEAAGLERDLGVRVDPLLAVSVSEGRVVVRLRGLLTALGVLIGLLAALGTATTLMASVLQRRREIALEKSLGAEPTRLFGRFLAEGAAIGALGGAVGAAAGLAAADAIEHSLFGVSLTISSFWAVAPVVLSMGIAAVACLPSVRRALATEAITVLRDE